MNTEGLSAKLREIRKLKDTLEQMRVEIALGMASVSSTIAVAGFGGRIDIDRVAYIGFLEERKPELEKKIISLETEFKKTVYLRLGHLSYLDAVRIMKCMD